MAHQSMHEGWAVYVIDEEGYCKTMFRVGHQYFQLAYVERPDEDALSHCEFIQKRFLEALEKMGIDISKGQEQ